MGTILHYSLEHILPDHHVLTVNVSGRILSLFAQTVEHAHPFVIREEHFSMYEMRIIVPILNAYPRYCPYEVLSASFYTGNVTEKNVKDAKQRIEKAKNSGCFDAELRPIRNVTSRARIKMRRLSVEISSIVELGSILTETHVRKSQNRIQKNV